MASDVEIDRALHTIASTLNDQQVEDYDRSRVQGIVTESLGGEDVLTADDGGGLHDRAGKRIGAIRRTDSGEWIVERQNPTVENSEQAIPTPGKMSGLRKVLTKLNVRVG